MLSEFPIRPLSGNPVNREVALRAMSAPIASQAMNLMLQAVQISYIYYLVTKLSYSSLQPSGDCAKEGWRL
jgi:hypothetical protein